MTTSRFFARRGPTAALIVLPLLASAPAHAQSFELIMQGALDARSSIMTGNTMTPIAGTSAFTLTAFFNTASGNLVAPIPFPGFVAYTPTAIQLTVGGRTYALQGFDAAHPTGVSVAIFDQTTPFGVPGRYGVGFIQNPLADGAGMIADYVGASPNFVIGATGLRATTFTGYSGVGVSSGVCTQGTGDNCQAHATTPIPMTFLGQPFSLVLGNYEDEAANSTTFTTALVAVPEPGTLALVGVGITGLVAAARRSRRRS